MPAKFWWDNAARKGTLPATTSEDPEYPAANLIDSLRTRTWKTGNTIAVEYAYGDFGSNKAVDTLAILDHDLTAADAVTLILTDQPDWTGGTTWAATIVPGQPILLQIGATVTLRYWALRITKAAAANVKTIGKVFLGTTLNAPPVTLNGIQRMTADLTKTIQTTGGQQWAYIRPRYDEVTMKWTFQPLDFLNALADMGAGVGTGQDLFFQVDQDAGFDKVYYGRLVTVPKRDFIMVHKSGSRFNTEVRLRESL